jgi:hypothetical protein
MESGCKVSHLTAANRMEIAIEQVSALIGELAAADEHLGNRTVA